MSPQDSMHPAPPTLNTVLRESAHRLTAVSDSPGLDAELLLCHALQCDRTALHLRHRDACAPPAAFEHYLTRRLNHEPVAYILGNWEFYGLEFFVRPPILIPRPETELLIDLARDFLGAKPREVLEVGTGSGCIAITLARYAPQARIYATDINLAAITLARENAAHHGVSLRWIQGNLLEPFPTPTGGLFDLILSNPPYVESTEWESLAPDIRHFEDVHALLSGEDGLDCIRKLIGEAPARLRPGGMLAFELGEKQWPSVHDLLWDAGFEQVDVLQDLAGIPRIAHARKPG